jgi:hypothetical protein
MMKDSNAKSEITVLDDDQMAALLANSNWAKMERDSRSLASAPANRCAQKHAEGEGGEY